jgi:hypothetical protein
MKHGGYRMPKVTIGLPVFNGEKYLAQAIDSVLGQTFENLQVLCREGPEDLLLSPGDELGSGTELQLHL